MEDEARRSAGNHRPVLFQDDGEHLGRLFSGSDRKAHASGHRRPRAGRAPSRRLHAVHNDSDLAAVPACVRFRAQCEIKCKRADIGAGPKHQFGPANPVLRFQPGRHCASRPQGRSTPLHARKNLRSRRPADPPLPLAAGLPVSPGTRWCPPTTSSASCGTAPRAPSPGPPTHLVPPRPSGNRGPKSTPCRWADVSALPSSGPATPRKHEPPSRLPHLARVLGVGLQQQQDAAEHQR